MSHGGRTWAYIEARDWEALVRTAWRVEWFTVTYFDTRDGALGAVGCELRCRHRPDSRWSLRVPGEPSRHAVHAIRARLAALDVTLHPNETQPLPADFHPVGFTPILRFHLEQDRRWRPFVQCVDFVTRNPERTPDQYFVRARITDVPSRAAPCPEAPMLREVHTRPTRPWCDERPFHRVVFPVPPLADLITARVLVPVALRPLTRAPRPLPFSLALPECPPDLVPDNPSEFWMTSSGSDSSSSARTSETHSSEERALASLEAKFEAAMTMALADNAREEEDEDEDA